MEKTNSPIPAGKLLSFAIIGVCLGFGVFLITDNLSGSNLTLWRAVVALFSGVSAFTIPAGVTFFVLYKRSHTSIKALKEQSSIDTLTELYNRNYLEPFLDREINAAKKDSRKISVIMVDMDHFKEINDTYGHAVGDHVLTIFAQVVLKCIRKNDIIARYGGDEFIVVLPDTDTDTAETIAERIRKDVSETYIPEIEGVSISSIHCSVGISTYPVHCDSKNSLIRTSDLALYMAKRSGRNCIKVYQNDLVPG